MSESESKNSLNPKISRRSLAAGVAAGAAWSVPAVMSVGAAPAFAVSPREEKNKIVTKACRLFYGGGSVNYQTHSIYLSVAYPPVVDGIPAGTVFTWFVVARGRADGTGGKTLVPEVNYPEKRNWALSVTEASRANDTDVTFKVELKALENLNHDALGCDVARIIWGDSSTIVPGANVAVESGPTIFSDGTVVQPGESAPKDKGGFKLDDSTLTYEVAKRFPSRINDRGRLPHIYKSRSGGQKVYPTVQWSRVIDRSGYDNMTVFPPNPDPVAPDSYNGSNWVTDGRA